MGDPEGEARKLPVPSEAQAFEVLEAAAVAVQRGVRGAMATVLGRRGSTPSTPGQKLFFGVDGTCLGTVGGGAIERDVLTALVDAAHGERDSHEMRTFKLGPELGMCCGGRVDVLLEVLPAVTPCLIVGAGHVATALGPLLSRVGFAVTIVDARPEWSADQRVAGVRALTGEFDDAGQEVEVRGPCLVMTHDHGVDQRAVEWALRRGFAFVGCIGSRAKAEKTRARLEAKGFSEADRARVRMPLGVPIGSRLPDEIAISVAAELIAWKRGVRGAALARV